MYRKWFDVVLNEEMWYTWKLNGRKIEPIMRCLSKILWEKTELSVNRFLGIWVLRISRPILVYKMQHLHTLKYFLIYLMSSDNANLPNKSRLKRNRKGVSPTHARDVTSDTAVYPDWLRVWPAQGGFDIGLAHFVLPRMLCSSKPQPGWS